MRTSPKEKLLRDVLENAGFRQELLEASRSELRKRKRLSKRRPLVLFAVAAALVLSVGLLFVTLGHRARKEAGAPLPKNTPSGPSYASLEIVTTSGPAMTVVESRDYPTVVIDTSSVGQPVEWLGDTELLALFPGKAAGLIADSAGDLQLVFLDPDNRVRR